MMSYKGLAVDKPPDEGFLSWDLEGPHSSEMLAFRRLMSDRSGFSLLILQYNDPLYRDKVVPYLNRYAPRPEVFRVDPETEFLQFEKHLIDISADHDLLQVIGLTEWLAGRSREAIFRGFNYHRELLAEKVEATIALWMTESDIRDFALEAPDMWAWRTGVFDFSISVYSRERDEVERTSLDFGSADLIKRESRMKEIEVYLAEHPKEKIPHANLLRELGQIYQDLGRIDDALTALANAGAIYRRNDHKREHMFVLGDIARIYVDKGDVDEALKLHKEMLDVFEQLGDRAEKAHTLWSIAQIDIEKEDYKNALQYLTTSYGILLKIGSLNGICFIGLDFGRLLCSMNEIERGREVLRRSEEGFHKLGREDLAKQVRDIISSLPTSSQ